jgi:anti-sigma factor RsiW
VTGEPLSCQELVELVTEYLDGDLPPAERLKFEEHIAICPPCRAHLAQMRRIVRSAGQLTEETIPADAREAMLEAFRDWKSDEADGGSGA